MCTIFTVRDQIRFDYFISKTTSVNDFEQILTNQNPHTCTLLLKVFSEQARQQFPSMSNQSACEATEACGNVTFAESLRVFVCVLSLSNVPFD